MLFHFEDGDTSASRLGPRLVVELAFAAGLPGGDSLLQFSDGSRYAVVGSAQPVAPILLGAGAGAALALPGHRWSIRA